MELDYDDILCTLDCGVVYFSKCCEVVRYAAKDMAVLPLASFK
ncbi:hypothetical protein [Halodesulfovibrio aestuarii]